jgi:hypothetical protein
MPWTILAGIDVARRRARVQGDRLQGCCRTGIDVIAIEASALLRRRASEDMAMIAALITDGPHCVPCIALLTHLDARRIYTALEQLKAQASARLVSGQCTHCRRSTTVHTITPH